MAKVKRGIVKLSGKVGDQVFVDSRVNGHHARKAVDKGTKKDEPALQKNFSRTGLLDGLGSEMNIIMKAYADSFKSSRFYSDMHRRFRQEDDNNRFLLLLTLKDMQINPDYPSTNMGQATSLLTCKANKFHINLRITSHPSRGRHEANGYYYEVIFVCWGETGKATHSSQLSDWIPLLGGRSADQGLPEFEFVFPKPPGTAQWLLCLRQRLAVDQEEVEAYVAETMQIVDIGSLDKNDLDLLKKKEEKKELEKIKNRKKKEKIDRKRVKAIRVH